MRFGLDLCNEGSVFSKLLNSDSRGACRDRHGAIYSFELSTPSDKQPNFLQYGTQEKIWTHP